jgi:hypothetical protein
MITDALNIARMDTMPTRQTTVFGLLSVMMVYMQIMQLLNVSVLVLRGRLLIILRNIV